MTNNENEIMLVAMAKNKQPEALLGYLAPHIDALITEFTSDPKIAALEIPRGSLHKAAEGHLAQAVERYSQLIEKQKDGDQEPLPPFTTFYSWFATQGMTEYAHHWQMILIAGGCGDCGTHSH